MKASFFTEEEEGTISQFLNDGYVIFSLKNIEGLNKLRNQLYEIGVNFLNLTKNPSLETFFNQTQDLVPVEQLNEFRVTLISHLAENDNTRPLVYSLAKSYLHWLIGNELAMQRSCNLSIQLPGDSSSLLPVHSDVWSGNSPYEIVLWIPLVDCYQSKSMFILPRQYSVDVYQNFKQYSHLSSEEFYEAIKDNLVCLNVPYGKAVIFSHTLPHGNRINQEEETRWTINIRFKSLLSPYGTKELGESFFPVTLRPATRIGMSYMKPEC
ncbi:sporadic carbohydrate cluster 2OG-Fe(II) oxygenase (plasmid) [Crocosphaera watsonii WH 8501]|uniref:Phytanoyl-CoA dioxygenase n=1 Tax=Crocosphaera watsonii WH 8501 TaxID=165597 RepID=Q4BV45_CROWT|nr:sporadic carbohydrate cluster 2OG-Fe(II) oxygenase [Crocosphaera watsonii]EAM47775.1 hypothetical protein CwatDRAFT_0229 [Crocosphaera watsonii WH 8501]